MATKVGYWLTADGLVLIQGWARDGLTDEQISKNMGISRPTLHEWRKKHSAIFDAIKKNKDIVDREVENALLKRIKGYTYIEIKTEITTSPDGEMLYSKKTEITKHVAADVTACAIWLNNRKPDSWRRNHNKEKLDEKRFEEEKDVNSKKHF